MRTLIVGGGAAGLSAAIAAAGRGDGVTVLERNRRPLKKLGVTGNGRGNLLNSGEPVFYGNREFALKVLSHMPYARVRAFLEDLGITLTREEERVYPAALMAGVAADAMLLRAEKLGVAFRVGTRAVSTSACGGGFEVCAVESEYEPDRPKAGGKVKKGGVVAQRDVCYKADRLIVTVGGAAAPAHGTDGTAYALLTAFGHRLTPLKPALCALVTEERPIAGLAGQRVRAGLRLTGENGGLLHESAGEALFAGDGVSGIAAMQLARFVEPGCTLHMDLREALLGAEEAHRDAFAWLAERREARAKVPLCALLTGAASAALSQALLRAAKINNLFRPAASLADEEAVRLARAIADFSLRVLETRGFEAAQVTAGGVEAAAFDPSTMESRLQKGLYAAGEVLDVDGDCGGYNLMFAFAGGLLAGRG